MKNFIEFEFVISEVRSVLYSIKHTYPTSDVTNSAESTFYILQLYANNFATRRDFVLQQKANRLIFYAIQIKNEKFYCQYPLKL